MATQKILSRIAIPVALFSCGLLPVRVDAQTSGAGVIVYLDPMTTAGVGGTVNLAPRGEETNLQVTLNPGEKSEGGSDDYRMQVVEEAVRRRGGSSKVSVTCMPTARRRASRAHSGCRTFETAGTSSRWPTNTTRTSWPAG